MNKPELNSYKRQLLALQKVSEQVLSTTTELLSQIDRELNPDQKKTAKSTHAEKYDIKQILVDSGFFTCEEIESDKALIPTVKSYNLTENQLRSTLEELFPQKDAAKNKAAFLIYNLKRRYLL